jgi:hypothetical protein
MRLLGSSGVRPLVVERLTPGRLAEKRGHLAGPDHLRSVTLQAVRAGSRSRFASAMRQAMVNGSYLPYGADSSDCLAIPRCSPIFLTRSIQR